jgi:hypothetical protein
LKKLIVVFLSGVVAAGLVVAQDKSPWPSWNKEEVDKILNHSAWAHTQTDTDVSEMTYSPLNSRSTKGSTNQPMAVNYQIRFLSAKPIRQAVARMIELREKGDRRVVEELRPFVERDFSSFIVVAVTVDSIDRRFSGPIMQVFASAAPGTWKNKAYLERKDGQRLFMIDYKAPINDGLGAKFIFPRTVDGKPFLTESGSVRFFLQLTDTVTLNVTYKMSDMYYEGKLEY